VRKTRFFRVPAIVLIKPKNAFCSLFGIHIIGQQIEIELIVCPEPTSHPNVKDVEFKSGCDEIAATSDGVVIGQVSRFAVLGVHRWIALNQEGQENVVVFGANGIGPYLKNHSAVRLKNFVPRCLHWYGL
jgi:hypothetical protein